MCGVRCVWSSSYLFWFEGGQLDLSEENMRRVIVSGDIEPSRLGFSLAVGRGGRTVSSMELVSTVTYDCTLGVVLPRHKEILAIHSEPVCCVINHCTGESKQSPSSFPSPLYPSSPSPLLPSPVTLTMCCA